MCRFTHFVAYVVASALMLSAAATLHAQTDNQVPGDQGYTLSLQEALLRIEASPIFKSAEKAVEASAGKLDQAGLWLNPEIVIELENFGGTDALAGFDGAETTVAISQQLEIGGKRSSRKLLAAQAMTLTELEKRSLGQDLRLSTLQAFYEVLAAQMRREQAVRLLELAEQGYQTVADRVEAGKVSPVQQLRASVELNTARSESETARRELVQARHELCAKWGDSKPDFATVVGNFEELNDPPQWQLLEASYLENPDVQGWETEVLSKKASLALERANSLPDLTLSFGVRKYEETGDRAYVAGLEFPLPFFDRNQGGRKAALAEVSQAVFQRNALLAQRASDLRSAYEALLAAHRRAQSLQNEIIPAAEQANEATQIGYQEGKFDFLDALDAQRTLFAVKAQYVDALNAYHRARLRVQRLAGLLQQN